MEVIDMVDLDDREAEDTVIQEDDEQVLSKFPF